MAATRLYELTALEIVHGTTTKEFTVEDVAQACLERIAERDSEIRAWEAIDPDAVLSSARKLDRAEAHGPLHGVPIGVKDVIDTADLPTQMGSPLYTGHRPPYDAACVARVRSAGALVLGKTVTAEFAGTAPTKTRNPCNVEHTPGGSSSGSGAAVADYMAPIAFGTQTGGSVLRPAAFCGVIGFKPSFGSYNTAGIKSAAESFDTIGLIARDVADIGLFHSALTNAAPCIGERTTSRPKFGVCRTHLWETALTETIEAVELTMAALREDGATVQEVELPVDIALLTEARAIINAYERAHGLAHEWLEGRDRLSAQMDETCRRGFAISRQSYIEAQEIAQAGRFALAEKFSKVDVLLTPVTPGEAPVGYDYAGDPRFQELWTMLHVPSITLPVHSGPCGLPVGIQLVGRLYGEPQLLFVARWLQDLLKKEHPVD